MVKTYRHKPIKVQALLFTGENLKEVKKFLGRNFSYVDNDLIFFEGGYDDVGDSCYKGQYLVKHSGDTVTHFTCMTEGELQEFYEKYLEEVEVDDD